MIRRISKVLIGMAAVAALFAGWLSGCSSRHETSAVGDAKVITAAAATKPTAATAAAAGEEKVTIDNFAFAPSSLTVRVGTKVTWLNRDDVPHTVTSSDFPMKFKSDALDTDQTYSRVFDAAGSYPYFCAVHPKMTGTVVVVVGK